MGTIIKKLKLAPLVMFVTVACLSLVSGCARYARTVNTLYEPSATVRGGTGVVYIVIPENRKTLSSDIKWVIGTVKDSDDNDIDEVFSPRSPAEIIQAALSQELKKAGYTVIPSTKRPAVEQRVIDLTKSEIKLEQFSYLADIKVKCRVLVGVDVSRNGQLIKRIQYESSSSKTDIKDRDMLAIKALDDALQSIMLEAVPEMHSLLTGNTSIKRLPDPGKQDKDSGEAR